MNHLRSIREESRILSATGAGRIPWVATEDIAAMGHYTLTVSPAPNRDFLVLGPELLTYDDVSQREGEGFTAPPPPLPTPK